jgi:hypothetical protein
VRLNVLLDGLDDRAISAERKNGFDFSVGYVVLLLPKAKFSYYVLLYLKKGRERTVLAKDNVQSIYRAVAVVSRMAVRRG